MLTIVCSFSAFSRRWIAMSRAAITRFAAAFGLAKDRLTTVTSATTAAVRMNRRTKPNRPER
jgi:hypothetical protein